MAENTKIPWADATANFWEGCTCVGDGCENCYAKPIGERMGVGWGDGVPRHRTSEDNWRKAPRWNAMHDRGQTHMIVDGKPSPVPQWVFPNSLSDFFDNHPDVSPWRAEAWTVIRRCPLICFIITTHRVSNVLKMLPADWYGGRDYRHVGIVASVSNQQEVDRDVPRLAALKAHGVFWIGLSIEPQLGPITIPDTAAVRKLVWVIGGGESEQTAPARRYEIEWAERLIAQCGALGIPYFQKQVGSNAFYKGKRFCTRHPAGAEAREWPSQLRVQQMPSVYDRDERRVSQPTML